MQFAQGFLQVDLQEGGKKKCICAYLWKCRMAVIEILTQLAEEGCFDFKGGKVLLCLTWGRREIGKPKFGLNTK